MKIIGKLTQQHNNTIHAELTAEVPVSKVMNVSAAAEDLLLPPISGLNDLFGKSGAELGLSKEAVRFCDIFLVRANAERYYIYKIGLTQNIRN